MKKIVLASFYICLAAVNITAAAAEEPYLKAPVDFNGTGCPSGSVTVIGENSPALAIANLYDAAKPRDNARSKMERTSCNFAVPVHVPAGYQVSLLTADWMGYAEGQTELFRRYTMMGISGGSPLPSQISNPKGNFSVRDAKLYSAAFSPCGKDVLLRVNSSVTAKGRESHIKINKILFHLSWVKCQ